MDEVPRLRDARYARRAEVTEEPEDEQDDDDELEHEPYESTIRGLGRDRRRGPFDDQEARKTRRPGGLLELARGRRPRDRRAAPRRRAVLPQGRTRPVRRLERAVGRSPGTFGQER